MTPNYLSFFKPQSTQKLYKLIIKEVMRITKADYGTIFLYRDNDLYRIYASTPVLFQITPRKTGYTRTTLKKHSAYLIHAESGKINSKTIKLLSVESDMAVSLLDNNQPIGLLSVMTKTPNKFTEKDFHKLIKIAPWVTQALKLSTLRSELKKQIEIRDLIISLTAHELKTPITSIYALSQLMERYLHLKKPIPTKMFQKLINSEKYLINLIDELLLTSRVQKGTFTLNLQKCDLREILNRSIVEFGYSHPKHKIIFKNNISQKRVGLYCDFDKIIQVFVNLLNNAGKYSPPNSTVKITLSKINKHYVINISDQGIGIPKEQVKKIFDPFFQANNINETQNGLGLGLYLTKQILDAHKANIKIDSEINQGTSVKVLFQVK